MNIDTPDIINVNIDMTDNININIDTPDNINMNTGTPENINMNIGTPDMDTDKIMNMNMCLDMDMNMNMPCVNTNMPCMNMNITMPDGDLSNMGMPNMNIPNMNMYNTNMLNMTMPNGGLVNLNLTMTMPNANVQQPMSAAPPPYACYLPQGQPVSNAGPCPMEWDRQQQSRKRSTKEIKRDMDALSQQGKAIDQRMLPSSEKIKILSELAARSCHLGKELRASQKREFKNRYAKANSEAASHQEPPASAIISTDPATELVAAGDFDLGSHAVPALKSSPPVGLSGAASSSPETAAAFHPDPAASDVYIGPATEQIAAEAVNFGSDLGPISKSFLPAGPSGAAGSSRDDTAADRPEPAYAMNIDPAIELIVAEDVEMSSTPTTPLASSPSTPPSSAAGSSPEPAAAREKLDQAGSNPCPDVDASATNDTNQDAQEFWTFRASVAKEGLGGIVHFLENGNANYLPNLLAHK
ncbi:hypothetical protein IF1G_06965 [Cordyceps javanica]|uniref:Uncharacterized protein n=1 Tax=Cordyceps javanica TaxID=43265 RepID=A0A545VW75_9HYPO|nr:hypothetical protein IF1G_06965 [Cordyceps javanica]TQW05967.1 hypothetical protein IF2G_06249 [Cordyceps javanica]